MPHYLEDNPDPFDTPEEVREAVREAGGDPMNVGTQQEAQFAWAILGSWADDPPASREDPAVYAAETEFVADELEHTYGVDLMTWPAIEDAPAWYERR